MPNNKKGNGNGKRVARRNDPTRSIATRGAYPVNNQHRCVLRYSDTLLASTAVSHTIQWRLNSLFDPDLTFAGHQPLGFDQLAALYGRYRVLRARLMIQARLPAISSVQMLCLANDAGVPTLNAGIEQPWSVFNLSTVGGPVARPMQTGSVLDSGWIGLNEIAGRTLSEYRADDRYQAAVSASPSEIIDATFVIMPEDEATTSTLTGRYLLMFDCEFFDRVMLGTS